MTHVLGYSRSGSQMMPRLSKTLPSYLDPPALVIDQDEIAMIGADDIPHAGLPVVVLPGLDRLGREDPFDRDPLVLGDHLEWSELALIRLGNDPDYNPFHIAYSPHLSALNPSCEIDYRTFVLFFKYSGLPKSVCINCRIIKCQCFFYDLPAGYNSVNDIYPTRR